MLVFQCETEEESQAWVSSINKNACQVSSSEVNYHVFRHFQVLMHLTVMFLVFVYGFLIIMIWKLKPL